MSAGNKGQGGGGKKKERHEEIGEKPKKEREGKPGICWGRKEEGKEGRRKEGM